MKAKNEFKRIVSGINLLFGLHTAVMLSLGVLAYIIGRFNTVLAANIILGFFYIGLLQLVYVIPIVIQLKRKQQWGKMKGVIVGAIITVILNLVLLILWLLSIR